MRRMSVAELTAPGGSGSSGGSGEWADVEAEMGQWPFLDENWSLGFDTGFESAWPGLS